MSEKERIDLFIKLTRLKDGVKVAFNTSHIIDIEPRTENEYEESEHNEKSWFGFGKERIVKKSKYIGQKEIKGSNITTTQTSEVKTRYYGEGTRAYTYGGSNIVTEVEESVTEILAMIDYEGD